VRARAPASSANLGPAFDALALALDCYVEVSVEAAGRFQLRSTGEGADLPADQSHLAAQIAIAVRQTERLAIEVASDIPVGRGLGSSAALAVAAAAAAGADDPFSYGVAVDGHPENAAAAAFGGLVLATTVTEGPVWRRLPLDPGLRFVALIPDRQLLTEAARATLPTEVPFADAVFNLGHMGLLMSGLADARVLIGEAGDDRLHQDYRAQLFPEAPALLAGLRQEGALTSFWSGAGPALIAVCRRADAPALADRARTLMAGHAVGGQVRLLDADTGGIRLLGA
jgi:homoserine kinase